MQSIALKIETGDGIRSQLETRKNGEGFFFFLLPERDIIARLVTRFNCGRSGVPFPPPPLFSLPPSKTSWRNYRCKSFPRHGRCEGSLGGEWEGGKEEWEGRRGWNCITQLIGSIYARTSTPEQYCCYSLMHFIFAGIAELTIIYHYLHGLAHNICYSAGARWADWCSTCEILAAI